MCWGANNNDDNNDDDAQGDIEAQHARLFLVTRLLVALLLGPPLNLTRVGLFPVEVGKDNVKDVAVPLDGVALDAVLDVLHGWLAYCILE